MCVLHTFREEKKNRKICTNKYIQTVALVCVCVNKSSTYLQALGDVFLHDTRAGLEGPQVDDELVSAQPVAATVEHVIVPG